MARIEWTEAYSVNNPVIDDQHQKLFSYVNTFNEGVDLKKSAAELLPVVDQIIDYTKYHFDEEEKIMSEISYPDIDRHKILHKKLIQNVLDARASIESNRPGALQDTQDFLNFWLKSHIKGIDTKYSQYF